MHPLNNHNFGVNGIAVSFYNGTSVVTGYVLRQKGSKQFEVTDGTNIATRYLAPTLSAATNLSATANQGYCTMFVAPPASGGTGASFTVNYGVSTATVVSSPNNFNVGDSLALPSGAGALTVATLNGSAIATVTVGTAGSYSSLFGSPTAGTRAAGTGATFTPHYGVDTTSTLGAAGSGYTVGDVLTLTGTGSATVTVATITGSGTGPVATFTVSAVGTVTALPSNPVAVTGGTGTGATFNLKWKLLSVTSSGGTGYNVGDTLNFVSLVATSAPTATIATATSHAATTVTVNSAGSGITTAAASVTTSTTTATFDLTYDVVSVTSSGGSGYAVNDTLDFNGLVAATDPTAYISTATSGAATATTVSAAGSRITTAASSISVNGPVQHVASIWEKKLTTLEGNNYFWTLGGSSEGSAVVSVY